MPVCEDRYGSFHILSQRKKRKFPRTPLNFQ
nr:MAG TPA: hypothetical protein [Caudoviricetes sp.]